MPVRTESYEPSIPGLQREFRTTLEERDRLTVRLVEILAAIRAISGVPNSQVDADEIREMEESIWQPKPGLALAVEYLLRASPSALTPTEIKNQLIARGYDLRKYSFAVGAIHGALRPLLERGMVSRDLLRDGRKAYRWAAYR